MTHTIPRRTDVGDAPLSYAQELLWQLDHATPGMIAYNAPRLIRIHGPLDVEALRTAIDYVVARHEVLRTTYHQEGAAVVQRVQAHTPFAIDVVDVRAHADGVAESERLALEWARTPFDFARDLFLRARLIRVHDADWVLVLVSHHIVSDGWSRDVLFREISAGYDAAREGRAPDLPPLPVQVADFAAWQRSRGTSAEFAHDLEFWLERLADPPVLQLPTVFPRPTAASFDGGLAVAIVPPVLVSSLRRFAVDRGATLYMVLLAAYQSLLHRYTGQDDIIVGSPIAARDLEELEGLIGYFANTLAMRTRFAAESTFAEIVEQVIGSSMDAYEHFDVPFEQLQLLLREQGSVRSDAPIVRVVLTMEDTLAARLTLSGTDVTIDALDYGQAKFDLALLVSDKGESIRLSLWYRTDLFDAAFASRALEHLQTLIGAAIAEPDVPVARLRIVSEAERAQLSAFGDGGPVVGQATRIDARVAHHARRTPDTIALRSGDETLTYAELDARAGRLASQLRSAGVSECVGICEDHSLAAVIGIIGILRAGCAYVPLPPHIPVARLRQQASDAQVDVVVCSGKTAAVAALLGRRTVLVDDGDDAIAVAQPYAVAPAEQSLAYVLFTSGSTGAPKGVAITQANLGAYVDAILARLEVPPDISWTFGLVSSMSADLGNTALFAALASGGTLDVVPREALLDPAAFGDYVTAHPIDVLKITPSHLQALLTGAAGMRILPQRWLVVGGEPLSVNFAREIIDGSSVRLLNHYGPTETTVGCCTYEVDRDALASIAARTVPIGRPLAGVDAHVLDAAGMLAPVDIPGELWISGAGVAAGYVARPEWTAERFVRLPGDDRIAYRTGDRARWRASGELEFLGRADDQVKIRGFRVELGEIEAAIARCDGIGRAVVVTRGEGSDRQLVAFVEGFMSASAIRDSLARELPEYMLPAEIVSVSSWPLTRSGKIDRMALANSAIVAEPTLLPRTDTERRLAEIWRAVLKRDEIGVHESFFDLGGHSLLAIRVLGRISRDLGVRLPLRALFEAATIEQLARVVDHELSPADDEAALREALAAVAGLSESEVAGMLHETGEKDC